MNGLRNRKALYRTSHRRCSIKRALGKSFAIFIGKHMCCSLFSIKLLAFKTETLSKRGFNTGVFL